MTENGSGNKTMDGRRISLLSQSARKSVQMCLAYLYGLNSPNRPRFLSCSAVAALQARSDGVRVVYESGRGRSLMTQPKLLITMRRDAHPCHGRNDHRHSSFRPCGACRNRRRRHPTSGALHEDERC